MFSSDKNIESIAALVEELKKYLTLRTELTKLDIVEKSVRVITALFVAIIVLLLVFAAIMYLSFAAAYALGDAIGNLPGAFLIVAGAYLLLILLVFRFRKSLIERPFVGLLSAILLN